VAVFSNPSAASIHIANYDKFLTSLPNDFQRGRERCDLIITDGGRIFILGEMKDSPAIQRHRKKAKKQLLESLDTLLEVPAILSVAGHAEARKCCYFNKWNGAPAFITATNAFNRLSTITSDGLRMDHPEIEARNFEFWEYLGGQILSLE